MADQREGARGDATPLWFGPTARPLFGWLHLPTDHKARGGVVLCQPLGIEATCVYYTYRVLADRLADMGLAVLRFDYDGTGDSSGAETDPDRLEAWLDSVTAATDFLAATGVGAIGLVGVRIGGLFAASEAARRGGVDALALWDPCVSGSAFLREQRFLRLMAAGNEDSGNIAVEAPGIRFETETVTAFSDLDFKRLDGTLAKRTLVLVPPDHSRPRALTRRLDGQSVDWQEATGQDRLLDSQRQEPPYGTIERVVSWLSEALAGTPVPVTFPVANRGPAEVGRTPTGQPVLEQTVRLGPLDLFGITTEGDVGERVPTIVLVDEGNTHHIGQARIWVDLARQLGASGFRVLRFDLSGNGDSGTRPGQRGHVVRPPEAFEDIGEAMRAISPQNPSDVVLIGFCSGAYEVLEQAVRNPPRGICVINPSFAFVPPEPEGTFDRHARQITKPWFTSLVNPAVRLAMRQKSPSEVDRWTTSLRIGTWPVAVAKRRPQVPKQVWSLVNRFLLERTAVETLEHIVDSGVDTVLISGPGDLLPLTVGSEDRVKRLQHSPRFRLVVLEELAHAAWEMDQRVKLMEVLCEHLDAQYRPTSKNTGAAESTAGAS